MTNNRVNPIHVNKAIALTVLFLRKDTELKA